MLQVITDSSADLPVELVQKYNIHVVPLTVTIDGEEYIEGVTLTPQEFQQKMLQSPTLPKTAQPAPETFARVFRELSAKGKMLCLTLSSKLSGTYQSALIGKEAVGGEVTVFDTLAGSLGHGLQVLKAAEMARLGASVEEVVEHLKKMRNEMNILILLDVLENIVKGGRLSRFHGSLAKILNLKVLLEGVEGVVELKEKVVGKKKFLRRVLEVIAERKSDFSNVVFGITHVDNVEDAEYLRDEIITRFRPKEVIVNYMGSTMGTYAGRGGITISF